MHNEFLAKTKPDKLVKVKEIFHCSLNFEMPAFSNPCVYTPEPDEGYSFDEATLKAILLGLIHNKRVLIQGFHGTGKSTHIEQVCSRLNWPCMRLNLDGYITRSELIGKDIIMLEDGKQISKFQDGIIPFALKHPMVLILDEFDAGRPDVLFVLQRLLEAEGHFALSEQNIIIKPHEYFRIFATCNTLGFGDSTGMYQGTNVMNQGQLDRFNMVVNLNFLPFEKEVACIAHKSKSDKIEVIEKMVKMAGLTRNGFVLGDITLLMSPRTVLHWLENYLIIEDVAESFALSFFNRIESDEKPIIAEYYQRVFASELSY